MAYTPTTKSERLGNGHVGLTSYASVAFRNDKTKGWTPTSADVTDTTDPAQPLEAAKSYKPLKFGSDPKKLLEISWDGAPLTLSAPWSAKVKPSKDASDSQKVKYKAVGKDVDVDYIVGTGGVKELITLLSAKAARSFTFHLSDPTGQLGAVRATGSGGYAFTKPDGEGMVLALPPAVAYEQPTGEDLPDLRSGSASQSVTAAGDGFDITLAVDPQWLQGKSFPIVLDPTLTVAVNGPFYQSYDCWLENGTHATTTQCTQSLVAGTNQGEWGRTVVQLDLPGVDGTGARINQAQFKIRQSGNQNSCGTTACNQTIVLRQVAGTTGSWNMRNWPTWYRYDGGSSATSWASVGVSGGGGPDCCNPDIGSYVVPYNQLGLQPQRTFDSGTYPNLLTTVQGWSNNAGTNHGINIRGYEGPSTAHQYVTFLNRDQAPATPASMYVDYTPKPTAPTGVSAVEQDASLQVSWTAPGNASDAQVNGYKVYVYQNGNQVGSPTTCAASSCVVGGLGNGTAYTVRVSATNSFSESPTSDPPAGPYTPYRRPLAVGSPSANVTPAAGQATISWTVDTSTPGTAQGRPITNYTVTPRTVDGAGNRTNQTATTCASSPCTVGSLTNGQQYDFMIWANNLAGAGDTAYTAVVKPYDRPGQPIGVTAEVTAAPAQATVSWTAFSVDNTGTVPRDNGRSITNFHITAYLAGTGTVAGAADCAGPTSVTSCTITGLLNGTSYQFTVIARNLRGDSLESAASPAKTPYDFPPAPTAVTATDTRAAGTADISWTQPGTGGSPVTSWTVISWAMPARTAGPSVSCSASPCALTGLSNGQPYVFQVQAVNARGAGSWSADSNQVTPYNVPNPPTNVAVNVDAAAGQAAVSWTAPTFNGGRPILDYTVTAAPSGGGTPSTATCTTSPCTVTGLSNAVSYSFTVTARNVRGSSGPSIAVTATPYGVPGQPTAVTADPTPTAGALRASWNAPANGGSPITSYTVQAYPADAPVGTRTPTVTATCPASPCDITALANGTAYVLTLAATNNRGTGPVSQDSSPATPYDVPAAPATATATPGNGQVIVSWTAGNDGGRLIDRYDITLYRASDDTAVGTPATTDGDGRTVTISASNGVSVYAKVTAHNLRGDSLPRTTGSVTPLQPVAIDKTLAALPGGSAGPGDLLTYTITLTNPNPVAVSNVTLTDTLPAGAALVQRPLTTGPVCTSTGVTCTFAATSFTFNNLTVPANGTLTVPYTVQAGDGLRSCTLLRNTASATDTLGAHSADPVDAAGCDAGLGLEPWWTMTATPTGPQSALAVNVANGNAVLQATDTTPVQAHGHLTFALRRTYNSQQRTAATLPGSLGAGWQFNFGEASSADGADSTGGALIAPSLASALDTVLNPLAVTLVDRDGTRHLFRPRPLSASARVDTAGLTGAQLPLAPTALVAPGSGPVCLDVAYDAPKGVHLGLWRYVQLGSGSCTDPDYSANSPVVVGFAAERPDRLRSEYDATGRLLALTDGSGVTLRYLYDPQTRLSAVYESRSCGTGSYSTAADLPASCRAFRFDYTQAAASTPAVTVTDPAGRATRYEFDQALPTNPTQLTAHLTRVVDPDGIATSYSYGGCGGSSDQLCAITDRRGNSTTLTYTGGDSTVPGSPARVLTVTDRRGAVSTYSYDSTGQTTVSTPNASPGNAADRTTSGRRHTYTGLDDDGRVGNDTLAPLTGATAGPALRTTSYGWDSTGCRLRTSSADNNLCTLTRGNTGAAGNETSTFQYEPTGPTAVAARRLTATTNVTTTWGYTSQYVRSSGPATVVTDTTTGAGQVTPGAGTPTGPASDVLFVLTDQTQMLTPRGNTTGAAVATYRTDYTVDNAPAAAPNTIPTAPVCTTPTGTPNSTPVPTSNTGLLCQSSGPSSTGDGQPTTSRATYDTFGQKLSATSPKAVHETATSTAAPATVYTYFSDGDRDITGAVNAGGWLREVFDPTSTPAAPRYVAFDVDAAGNTVRSWDRDSSAGQPATNYPGTLATSRISGAPSGAALSFFNADSNGNGLLTDPWRYIRVSADPLGNRTVTFTDPNGNPTTVRPPRGTAAGNTDFDITRTFDDGDLLTTVATARQRAATPATGTAYSYDPFANRTSTTGPNDPGDTAGRRVSVMRYDAADRLLRTLTSRDQTDSTDHTCRTGDEPSGAGPSLSTLPILAGHYYCTTSTSYDQVDNAVTSTDGSGVTTMIDYDAAHRPVARHTPRSAGTTLISRTVYDEDGHPLDVCTPRQSGACTSTSVFATHTRYNPAGRPFDVTRYRDAAGSTPLDTLTSYDADGNVIATTDPRGTNGTAVTDTSYTTTAVYNLLDRRISMHIPRAGVTQYLYSAAGDLIATGEPGVSSDNPSGPPLRITGHSYDADHRALDTVTALQVSSFDISGVGTAIGNAVSDAVAQRNLRRRVHYDPDGRVDREWSPRAFVGAGSPASAALIANPDCRFKTTRTFTPDGQTATTQVPRNTTSAWNGSGCTSTGYPGSVNVLTTTYTYDLLGNLSTVNPPNTPAIVRYTYTDDNLRSTTTAPDPSDDGGDAPAITVSTVGYDGAGRATTSTDAQSKTTTTSYTLDGLVEQVDNPTGPSGQPHRTSYGYDADGDRSIVGVFRTVYSPSGAVTGSETDQTVTSYTPDGRIASVATGHVAGGGNANDLLTSYTYDPAGNPATVVSPEANAHGPSNPTGAPVTYTYSPDNLLLQTLQPAELDAARATVIGTRQTDTSYDVAGRKTAVHVQLTGTAPDVGDGGTQTFAYYPNGLIKTETGRSADGMISHYYDAAGNQTEVSGIQADYSLDNLIEHVHASGYADDRTTDYSYDGRGNITRRTVSAFVPLVIGGPAGVTSSTAYTRNLADLVVRTTEADGGITTYSHNTIGQVTGSTRPNGTSQTWTYLPDQMLDSTSVTASGANRASWSYRYDEAGRILSQSYTGTASTSTTPSAATATGSGPVGPDATDTLTPATYRTSYDPAGRLASFTDTRGTRTVAFDRDGNRTTYGLIGEPDPSTFTYNPDDSIHTGAVTTDPTSGTASRTYQYWPFGGVHSDGCHTDTYDGLDRLESVVTEATAGCGTSGTVTYTYDGLDRQLTRKQGAVTVRLAYDGLTPNVTREDSISGAGTGASAANPDTRFIAYTLDPEGAPATVTTTAFEQAPVKEYIAGDGTGSTGNITNADGTTRCTARYDAYGNPDTNTPSAPAAPLGSCASGQSNSDIFYRSARKDTTTGNYQLGSRTYDPSKGAFLTPDTYRTGGSDANTSLGVDPLTRNTYGYVNGDPVNGTDPSGHRIACDTPAECRDVNALYSSRAGVRHTSLGRLHAAFADVDSLPDSTYLVWGPVVGGLTGANADASRAAMKLQILESNPRLLQGIRPEELLRALGQLPDGWSVERMAKGGHAGTGLMIRGETPTGGTTRLQWSPGSSRKFGEGNPYWRLVNGNNPKSAPHYRGGTSEFWGETTGMRASEILNRMQAAEGGMSYRPVAGLRVLGGGRFGLSGEGAMGGALGALSFLAAVVDYARHGQQGGSCSRLLQDSEGRTFVDTSFCYA